MDFTRFDRSSVIACFKAASWLSSSLFVLPYLLLSSDYILTIILFANHGPKHLRPNPGETGALPPGTTIYSPPQSPINLPVQCHLCRWRVRLPNPQQYRFFLRVQQCTHRRSPRRHGLTSQNHTRHHVLARRSSRCCNASTQATEPLQLHCQPGWHICIQRKTALVERRTSMIS